MNDLIAVSQNEDGEVVVSARDVYEFLQVESRYQDWFKRMVEYGFTENSDFISIVEPTQKKEGSRIVTRDLETHIIKLDMAKELCMLTRNERGKQARQYFIQIEKAWNSPEMIMKRALEIANRNVEKLKLESAEKDKKLELQKPKVEFVDHIATSENSLLIREVAKVISKKGIKIGERKLYEKLREWKLVFKNSCEATQKAIDQGLLEVVEGAKENSKGTFTYKTTKITGKGQIYIFEKLIAELRAA